MAARILPVEYTGRGLATGTRETYDILAINWEAVDEQLGTLCAENSAQDVDECVRLIALDRMPGAGDHVGASEADQKIRYKNYQLPPPKQAGKKIAGDPAVQAKELARLLHEEAKVI